MTNAGDHLLAPAVHLPREAVEVIGEVRFIMLGKELCRQAQHYDDIILLA
ncbi:hypothetical protein WJ0W_005483 [Paenibacillus melissococcoides]|uniref:Uncharacterized protein n=1 Tax=Paenibacillus melissococcoides TaxID=2912268 RepID=A0ABN8UDP5_9BACL|nr:hypothetical protein WJ0W_005483 [Paenibacillus melissococcoides]